MSARPPMSPPPIAFAGRGEFLRQVRAQVTEEFAGQALRADPRSQRKAGLVAAWFALSYILFLSAREFWLQLALCLSYGLSASAVGLNIFHDASHGALTSSRRGNRRIAIACSAALGASRYFWHFKHQTQHHHYTNIHRWDDDLESFGWLRWSPSQPWSRRYRGQHLYYFVLYAFNSLQWFFVKDFVHYFTLRQNKYLSIPALSPAEKLEFWACKAVYLALFVALPFALMPAGRALVGLLIFHATFSLSLTLVFNLAHLVEGVSFPAPRPGTAIIADEWAAHQLRTTADFGADNRLLRWFAGGLNYQVEHHLFPWMSHTHYPAVSRVVRRKAAEFGLPYISFPTYRAALRSHSRFMRQLGDAPRPAHAI